MDRRDVVATSTWMSRHLRHSPRRVGLELQPGVWVPAEDLLRAAARDGRPFTREALDHVVATNDKQRFSLSEDGTRIRANQGHSVEVDLGLVPSTPPDVLFHGTGEGSVDSIRRTGLDRRRRHHVHLSRDEDTARRVGARHGRPVVLVVDAARMHADGFMFLVSDNGVWLCDHVPPEYLRVPG